MSIIANDPQVSTRVFSPQRARHLHLKSRSAWAKEGYVVPKDAAPVGYVVSETVKVKGIVWGQIVVKDLGRDIFEVASGDPRKNYAVFNKELAAPKIKRQRKEKPVTPASVWNPADFDPQSYLPEHLQPYGDHARYLLHRVCYSQIFYKRGKGPVPLMAKLLRQFVPQRVYPQLRDALVESEVLSCDKTYQQGKKSYHFDMGRALAGRKFERVDITDRKLATKLLAYRADKEKQITEPVHHFLRDNLCKLDIDSEAALGSIKRKTSRRGVCLAASIEAIKQKDFWYTVCPHGRAHTNLTSLKSSLRKFLHVGGARLVNFDLKNSQPLFLGLLTLVDQLASLSGVNEFEINENHLYAEISDRILNNLSVINFAPEQQEERTQTHSLHTPSHYDVHFVTSAQCVSNDFQKESTVKLLGLGIPEDVLLYLDLCQTGQFYEFLMAKSGLNLKDRPRFKRRLYRRLFFGRDRETAESKLFASYFPTVYNLIRKVKGKDYRRLAHTLQRLESNVIIHRVVKRLMDEQPFCFVSTIHDSFVTTEDNAEVVLRIMRQEFHKLGLDPAISMEVFA